MAEPEQLRILNPPNADHLKIEQQTTAGTIVSYTIRNSANTPLPNADGGGGSIQVGTKAQMLAIVAPSAGQLFYINDISDPQFNKLCVYSGRCWGVPGETIECLVNEVGGLIEGNVVEVNPGFAGVDYGVRKATQTADRDIVGVCAFQSVADTDWCSIACRGTWMVAFEAQGLYFRGTRIKTDSTDGLAEDSGGSQNGVFGIILANFSAPSDGDLGPCVIFPVERT